MKIGVIAEQRSLRQEMPGALLQAFRARGLGADLLFPHGGRFDPRTGMFTAADGARFDLKGYDGLVARTRDGLGLAMLAYGDAVGIPTVNSPAAIQQVRNKAQVALVLSRARLPVIPSIVTESVSALAHLPPEWFPLLLKATYADNGEGLRLVLDPDELAALRWREAPVLAQRYMPNSGFDLKLYVCGRQVLGVRKPSPLYGERGAKAEPVAVTEAVGTMALRCGAAFGLDIFGVDALETPDGLQIVEVNDFPSFSGVPGAADLIADYILARLGDAPVMARATRTPRARVAAHVGHSPGDIPEAAESITPLVGARIAG